MTKKTGRGKKNARRLKLTKETVRDLDVREKGVYPKGGRALSAGCPGPVPIPYPDTSGCTAGCPLVTFVCVTNGCPQR